MGELFIGCYFYGKTKLNSIIRVLLIIYSIYTFTRKELVCLKEQVCLKSLLFYSLNIIANG